MEINEPGHGRTVISIEPVQQQPLYSIYVPPPPIKNSHQGHIPGSPLKPSPVVIPANSSEKAPDEKKEGDEDEDNTSTGTSSATLSTIASEPEVAVKPKRRLFGNLFGGGGSSSKNKSKDKDKDKDKGSSGDAPGPTSSSVALIPSSTTDSTTTTGPSLLFNRTNHPTRISEGEEEEDTEETII